MRRTWVRLGTALSILTLLSCQGGPAGPGLGGLGGPGRFALDFGGGVAASPAAAEATPSRAPAPPPPPAAITSTAAAAAPPVATPASERRRSGGVSRGGGGAPAQATPTPGPTPPMLEPVSFAATFGNPGDPLKIDGIRLDADFAANGKLHLAFSVIAPDGTDLSTRVDPLRARAVMSFSDAVPTPAPTPPPTPTPTPTATATPEPTPTPGASAAAFRLLDLSAIEVVIDAIPGNGRPPLDVVLAIDSTGSMIDTDPDRLRVGAAKGYVDQMRPADELAVMDFATGLVTTGALPHPVFDGIPHMRLLHAMSKDRDAAKAAIDLVTEQGGTNLYDALSRSITYLTSGKGNRPLGLIALTDGQDNASSATITQVAAEAEAHGVLLMLLAFSGYDEKAMHQVTTEAGGWFVGAEDPTTLETQFGAAVRTLGGNAQAIIYVPADQRIAKHMAGRMTVTIDGQDYSGTFNVQPPPVGP